jgi:spore germination protein YaaH
MLTGSLVCRYTCSPGDTVASGMCHIASSTQIGYPEIQQLLASTNATRVWQANSSTPHFMYREGGTVYRVDYDDSQSLRLKYTAAKELGVSRVGMWTASSLNYSDTKSVTQFWADLRVFNNASLL